MFTGIDIVVILLVLLIFLYTSAPDTKREVKIEPFTLLVFIVIASMIIVSFV
jgi:hypothetical protein